MFSLRTYESCLLTTQTWRALIFGQVVIYPVQYVFEGYKTLKIVLHVCGILQAVYGLRTNILQPWFSWSQ